MTAGPRAALVAAAVAASSVPASAQAPPTGLIAGAMFGQGVSIAKPKFVDYSRSWNATTGALTERFTIEFPACALPVSAVHYN
jgi:hypothetical protein